MHFYLAPLEGITGYIYRNAVHEFFGEGIVKYFTPFIAPRQGRGMKRNERRDILPENNPGIQLVPQILTKSPEDFLTLADMISEEFGYEDYPVLLSFINRGTLQASNDENYIASNSEEFGFEDYPVLLNYMNRGTLCDSNGTTLVDSNTTDFDFVE